MTETQQPKRPTWSEVARRDLYDQLSALTTEYLTEARLWHDEPGHETVARAASQVSFMAQLVQSDCAESIMRLGDDWLKAARRTLPEVRAIRERRTLIGGAR
ncbi:hypothetical protein [Agreia sp. VKM Ac-1783]|uniref:hypothetical protein n=1 Tax=Agreia sp. VKM Ac-1783 TaxID=1938889 RepID=UPI000A2AE2A2|nr:hypothetical protein [Agreia sp. VKM Ac-1783]SMQ73501.1 hypothetical protein SAMN06295943_2898 [Agreia sp. VKM Ac-1783]